MPLFLTFVSNLGFYFLSGLRVIEEKVFWLICSLLFCLYFGSLTESVFAWGFVPPGTNTILSLSDHCPSGSAGRQALHRTGEVSASHNSRVVKKHTATR